MPGAFRNTVIEDRESAELQSLAGWKKHLSLEGGLKDCSLIVATYKRPAEMVGLLDCLIGIPDPPGEVILVDGSPAEETQQQVSAWALQKDLPFDLLYVKSPAGLTRQRNAGIDASTREIVFFLDDDCLPKPGYFRSIREAYATDRFEEVGGISGFAVNVMGKRLPLRWRLRLLLRLVPPGSSGTYFPTATSAPVSTVAPFSGVRPVDIMPGCAMSFRRSVLNAHRFSSFFYGYSQGEDLEMSMRVRQRWKLLWCGDAHVVHNHVKGGRPGSSEKGRMEVRNRFYIWRRYSPAAPFGVRLNFWLDIGYIFLWDLVGFLAHPLQLWYIGHAWGIVVGAVGCIVSPPTHNESDAQREYTFVFSELQRLQEH